jgi:hypothetical protein
MDKDSPSAAMTQPRGAGFYPAHPPQSPPRRTGCIAGLQPAKRPHDQRAQFAFTPCRMQFGSTAKFNSELLLSDQAGNQSLVLFAWAFVIAARI